MDAPKPKAKRMRILALAALVAAGAAGEWRLVATRPDRSPIMAESVFAALGGFRSLAAEAVWFRADRLQEEGRYVELAQLASTLTFLEPHTPEVWSYAAWNLAYNISVMMPTHEDRWRWVDAALRLLRDDGLRLNPGDPDLCRDLAWMFQLKIGGRVDDASPLYREKWRAIAEDAAARNAWAELGMSREKMDEVVRTYGVHDDWTDAQLSALYWAHIGLASPSGAQTRAFLREIVRQARAMARRAAPQA